MKVMLLLGVAWMLLKIIDSESVSLFAIIIFAIYVVYLSIKNYED